MKVSYKWINEYFDGKAPQLEKAVELLEMHSMEIESSEKVGDDIVIDAKTTPNLNHSCLCHRGIARELGTIADIKINNYSRKFQDYSTTETSKKIDVKIDDSKLCRRYIGRVIENIKVEPSPKWLAEKLETLGQRSINNIVDATNFVMLEIGQPMHAFDADKIGNQIVVKNAYRGQRIITLDNKDVELDEDVLLITDGENPLAIAGIKGGKFAELDENTKNIILESANFDSTLIRKTSQRIKIQTDASKRYENDFSQEIAGEAMEVLTKLIIEIAGTSETKVGESIDNYPNKAEKVELGITAKEASDIIGIKISDTDIEKIFDRFNFEWRRDGEKIVIVVPFERLDLRIKEDLAEEIGRIYGYHKIDYVDIPDSSIKPKTNKVFAYKQKIRNFLYSEGFSEVMNYTFVDKGDIELQKPLSPEKKYLRTNLTDGIKNSLELNARYSEIIDMPQIKIFEFGHVFDFKGEYENFVIGIKNPIGIKKPKEKDVLDEVIKKLEDNLKLKLNKINTEENIAEFAILEMVKDLPEVSEYDFPKDDNRELKFKKISQYPFMIRDIAVFTPKGTLSEDVFSIIKSEVGDLMVKSRLFDVFEKTFPDGIIKVSYAYRLVFQSYERTLTDDEINLIMTKITEKMNKNDGWQVR